MPTYEYQCDRCGKNFEFFQSMSEPRKETCEVCGGKLTKLLSAGSGLIFKGSGFYITDYKKSGGGSGDSAGSKASESSASPDSGKSSSSTGGSSESSKPPAEPNKA